MAEHDSPWVLISILFSSYPLDDGLAFALHRVAVDLAERDASAGAVDHALAHGFVRNLHKEVSLGTFVGPAFEADIETERGKGQVRFLLTREGLALSQQGSPARSNSRALLN